MFLLKHNFGPYNVLVLENTEVNLLNATSYLGEIIKNKLQSEKIKFWDFVTSSSHIVIVTDDKNAYSAAKAFISSSFGEITLRIIHTKFVTHYCVYITIKNQQNLFNFLNKKALFPIYQLTDNFPTFIDNKIIVKVPKYLDINEVKNALVKSNKVNIRYTGGKIPMKSYDGQEVKVSEPVLQDTWKDQVLFSVTIHNKKILVAHFSSSTVAILNDLKVAQNGANVCIEIGGTIYSTLSLKAHQPIASDMYLVQCKTEQEAKSLLKHLNIGLLSSLRLVEERTQEMGSLWLVWLLLALVLLLMCLFLAICRRKNLILSMLISLLLFSYFSYADSGISFKFLYALLFQQIFFLLAHFFHDKAKYFGAYFSAGYCLTSVAALGYASISRDPYVFCVASSPVLSSCILLMTYNIIRAITFKRSNGKKSTTFL